MTSWIARLWNLIAGREGPSTRVPANAGKPWSEQDDVDLRDELALEASLDDIAGFLQRTPDEVRHRIALVTGRHGEPLRRTES
jgi:hypothetical protein